VHIFNNSSGFLLSALNPAIVAYLLSDVKPKDVVLIDE
jgi:hypothetical protein